MVPAVILLAVSPTILASVMLPSAIWAVPMAPVSMSPLSAVMSPAWSWSAVMLPAAILPAVMAPASILSAVTAPAAILPAVTAPARMLSASMASAAILPNTTAPSWSFPAFTAPSAMFSSFTAPPANCPASTVPLISLAPLMFPGSCQAGTFSRARLMSLLPSSMPFMRPVRQSNSILFTWASTSMFSGMWRMRTVSYRCTLSKFLYWAYSAVSPRDTKSTEREISGSSMPGLSEK